MDHIGAVSESVCSSLCKYPTRHWKNAHEYVNVNKIENENVTVNVNVKENDIVRRQRKQFGEKTIRFSFQLLGAVFFCAKMAQNIRIHNSSGDIDTYIHTYTMP